MYVLATFTVGKEMLAPAACVTKVAALAKSNATRILAKLPSLCDRRNAQERDDPWRGALRPDRSMLIYTSRICFLCMFDFFILYTLPSNPRLLHLSYEFFGRLFRGGTSNNRRSAGTSCANIEYRILKYAHQMALQSRI